MASHGTSRHLKRIASPKAMGLSKKKHLWLVKPRAGPHKKTESIALGVLLREVLGIAETKAQAKKLLAKGEVLVDGRKCRDEKMPVGLMDYASIPALKKHYRMTIIKGVLKPVEVKEAKTKLCKVNNKSVNRKGKIQLNCHDGRCCLIEKEEDRFKTGDTLKLSIPKQSLEGFLKLEKGANCLVYRGKHAGEIASLEELLERKEGKTEARLKSGDKEFITRKEYLFVVDKGVEGS